jgi:hypothetical protein
MSACDVGGLIEIHRIWSIFGLNLSKNSKAQHHRHI